MRGIKTLGRSFSQLLRGYCQHAFETLTVFKVQSIILHVVSMSKTEVKQAISIFWEHVCV